MPRSVSPAAAHLVIVRPKARETHTNANRTCLCSIHFFAAHRIPSAARARRLLGVALYGCLRRYLDWIVCRTQASKSCAHRHCFWRTAEAQQKDHVAWPCPYHSHVAVVFLVASLHRCRRVTDAAHHDFHHDLYFIRRRHRSRIVSSVVSGM